MGLYVLPLLVVISDIEVQNLCTEDDELDVECQFEELPIDHRRGVHLVERGRIGGRATPQAAPAVL